MMTTYIDDPHDQLLPGYPMLGERKMITALLVAREDVGDTLRKLHDKLDTIDDDDPAYLPLLAQAEHTLDMINTIEAGLRELINGMASPPPDGRGANVHPLLSGVV